MKASGPGLFFVEKVLITEIQSPYTLLVCLDFLFLHDSALIGCMFLGISSRLSHLLAYTCS